MTVEPIELALAPFAEPFASAGPALLRVAVLDGEIGLGVRFHARSEWVGGVADAAAVRRFARALLGMSAEVLGVVRCCEIDGHAAPPADDHNRTRMNGDFAARPNTDGGRVAPKGGE